ncbi:hypothetical protein [Sphingobacterium sp.]|uniref:hypothetical protein n=1 Tax=Sphingobacterium sp. TaxID=341027 RepID=UPI0028AEF2A8|nr:hypothetical protein [Sphingobacterium sp.]
MHKRKANGVSSFYLLCCGTKYFGEMRTFKIKNNQASIGVQFLDLRSRMTGSVGGEPYRFFTNCSEL